MKMQLGAGKHFRSTESKVREAKKLFIEGYDKEEIAKEMNKSIPQVYRYFTFIELTELDMAKHYRNKFKRLQATKGREV